MHRVMLTANTIILKTKKKLLQMILIFPSENSHFGLSDYRRQPKLFEKKIRELKK